MSGKEIGKKNRLYYPAERLYVHESLSLSQIQARLIEEFGRGDGYVSDTTLAKWRRAGGWDEKREAIAEADDIAALMERLEERIIGASKRLAAAFWKLGATAKRKDAGSGK